MLPKKYLKVWKQCFKASSKSMLLCLEHSWVLIIAYGSRCHGAMLMRAHERSWPCYYCQAQTQLQFKLQLNWAEPYCHLEPPDYPPTTQPDKYIGSLLWGSFGMEWIVQAIIDVELKLALLSLWDHPPIWASILVTSLFNSIWHYEN